MSLVSYKAITGYRNSCGFVREIDYMSLWEAGMHIFNEFGNDNTLAYFVGCDKVFRHSIFPRLTYEKRAIEHLNDVSYSNIIYIDNPNNLTGNAFSNDEIEKHISGNPSKLYIINESYINFGHTSAKPLIEKYENLMVIESYPTIEGISVICAKVYCNDSIYDYFKKNHAYDRHIIPNNIDEYKVATKNLLTNIQLIREKLSRVSNKNINIISSDCPWILIQTTDKTLLREMFECFKRRFNVNILKYHGVSCLKIHMRKITDCYELCQRIYDKYHKKYENILIDADSEAYKSNDIMIKKYNYESNVILMTNLKMKSCLRQIYLCENPERGWTVMDNKVIIYEYPIISDLLIEKLKILKKLGVTNMNSLDGEKPGIRLFIKYAKKIVKDLKVELVHVTDIFDIDLKGTTLVIGGRKFKKFAERLGFDYSVNFDVLDPPGDEIKEVNNYII